MGAIIISYKKQNLDFTKNLMDNGQSYANACLMNDTTNSIKYIMLFDDNHPEGYYYYQAANGDSETENK